jgi:two-component system sensor histidine kinase UhpB
VQQEQAGDFQVEVSHPALDHLDPQVGIVLFRVAQEALNNVRKHSGAKHARIQLGKAMNSLTMEVSDDGIGFDVEPVRRQAVQTV